jgi:hypothetical protein
MFRKVIYMKRANLLLFSLLISVFHLENIAADADILLKTDLKNLYDANVSTYNYEKAMALPLCSIEIGQLATNSNTHFVATSSDGLSTVFPGKSKGKKGLYVYSDISGFYFIPTSNLKNNHTHTYIIDSNSFYLLIKNGTIHSGTKKSFLKNKLKCVLSKAWPKKDFFIC